jgi:hypothetical protein
VERYVRIGLVNKDVDHEVAGRVDMRRIETEKVTPVQVLTRDLTVLSDRSKTAARGRRMETAELTTVIDPATVPASA